MLSKIIKTIFGGSSKKEEKKDPYGNWEYQEHPMENGQGSMRPKSYPGSNASEDMAERMKRDPARYN